MLKSQLSYSLLVEIGPIKASGSPHVKPNVKSDVSQFSYPMAVVIIAGSLSAQFLLCLKW